MSEYIIGNCNVITQTKILENYCVSINDGVISNIFSGEKVDKFDYDAKGGYVSAGLIDIHTHGGYGYDFMDATDEAFDGVLKFHIDNGTTSVMATSVTAPISFIRAFLDKAREYSKKDTKYAKLLGCHLEGPFLSIRNKGAQKESCILSPDKDDYTFIGQYSDVVKTVTIAPEINCADKMTEYLTRLGIIVCGGHDDGIYPEFMPAINSGLSHLTHIYCAMSELRFKDGKRNVGLREYGLIDDRLTAEIIADNRHLPPELVKMIIKIKGDTKLCVVSDSLRGAGMPLDGKLYKLGLITDDSAQMFKVSDGVAVLADGSRFAGSITPIRQMIINLINMGVPICQAFNLATVSPANIIGRKDIGRMEIGKVADVCVFDNKFNIIDVFKNGKIIKE